jgi:hypothetical protein
VLSGLDELPASDWRTGIYTIGNHGTSFAGLQAMKTRTILVLLGICSVFGTFSCGGSGTSANLPTAPSLPSSNTNTTTGAVINGTVIGRTLSTRSMAMTLDSPSTLTVTVGQLTVTVDASGHFEISGVPSGDINLVFRDGPSTWTVSVAGVVPEEQIQIQINLSSGTPRVVSETRSTAKVRLCHRTDANRYQSIEISTSAELTHRAHGDAAVGQPVPADPTKIFDVNCQVVAPSISIAKSTNGEDADEAPGPSIVSGSTVTWTFVVTNHGTLPLADVSVADDQGVVVNCGGKTTLAAAESMTCTATGVAIVGQYKNVGTATGNAAGVTVTHSDPSHYFGEAAEVGLAGPKVKLCHKKGKGRYQAIEVAASAERAHRAHGDAAIGEPAPLESGKTFGAACVVN